MSEFISKMIGVQDVENHKKIKTLYEELINRANGFVWDTQDLLNKPELKTEVFFELLKKNKPDLILYLKREYVKANNISIPGINMEKLIGADLVDLPKDYDSIVLNWKETNELVDKITATRFFFPLKNLVHPEKHQFELDEKFEESLLNFTATFTENEKQNEVLEVVERFCDVVNDMIELQIIKGWRAQWKDVCNKLDMGIAKNESSERPLSPDQKIFDKYYPLERFGNHKPFNPLTQTRSAILS